MAVKFEQSGPAQDERPLNPDPPPAECIAPDLINPAVNNGDTSHFTHTAETQPPPWSLSLSFSHNPQSTAKEETDSNYPPYLDFLLFQVKPDIECRREMQRSFFNWNRRCRIGLDSVVLDT